MYFTHTHTHTHTHTAHVWFKTLLRVYNFQKLKCKTLHSFSKLRLRQWCTFLTLLFTFMILSTSSTAQISAITQTESGGIFGLATSKVTTTISGLELTTNSTLGTVGSFNSGCAQETVISFEICNIEEVGTIVFDFNALWFTLIDAGDFTFIGNNGTGEFMTESYSADFEETNYDPYTKTATCVTLSITIAVNPIFNQFLDPFNVLVAVIDSPSNPNLQLNLPSYNIVQAQSIGTNATSTFLSSVIGTKFPNNSIACGGANNGSYAIFGDLIIDVDYCFNNLKFFMQPGSSIRIVNGSVLSVDASTGGTQKPSFLPCMAMWQGIIIEDGDLVMNESVMNGAETGIAVLPDNTVSVTNSDFTDNFIGVRFMDDANLPKPHTATVLGFYGNTFSGSGELPPLYPGQTLEFFSPNDLPYAGVLAEDYNLLPLVGTRLPTDLIPTKYSNMNNGIRFIDTDLNSSFSVFEDMPLSAIVGISNNNNSYIHFGLNDDPSKAASDQVDFLRCQNGISLGRMNAEIHQSHFGEIGNRAIQFQNCSNKNVALKKCRIESENLGVLSLFSVPLSGSIENNFFTPSSIHDGRDILCFEGFSSTSTPNPGNSWRIIGNNFDGSQGGRTAIQISGGSNFEIKENTITRSGNATGITKYGITLTNSSFPELKCNDISVNGQNHGQDVGIMVSSSIFGKYECNTVDNFVNNIQFENDNMRNLFKGNQMLNGDRGLVFGSNAEIGPQSHKGNCWSNNSSDDLSHASTNDQFVRRSLFTIKCLGEGDINNACGCDAIVSVQSGVNPTDLLNQVPFGFTESCGDDNDGNTTSLCLSKKITPGSPVEPAALSDRLNNLVYSNANANTMHWMSQFNVLRAIDNGMLSAYSQESEINNHRSQNVELDNHLKFWDDLSANNLGLDQNVTLSETFSSIHQLTQAIAENVSSDDQENLQSQLDQLIIDFQTQKTFGNAIYQSSTEAINNVYTNYNFGENFGELHLDYMAFVSNLFSEFMLNNNLDLDQNQEQLLYTIGTTCLDKAGPASNLAKALYFVVSDGLVLETEDCETVIEERTNRQKKLKPVRLYPNPSSGVISIDLLEDTDVEIVNQLGTVVRSYKLQSGTHTLNLDLSNGVYFIRDGKSLIEKILITK